MNNSFSVSYASGQISGKITWKCPSNIALIKYWGKRERQLPSNPSLSFSLTECLTETSIDYEFIEALVTPATHFNFNGKPNPKFQQRVSAFIEDRIIDIPDISHVRMEIQSKNTFPHSTGIASSASAFGALALCLCSIEEKINGSVTGSMDFFRKASYLARLGSGSACRSIYGGYTVWGDSEVFTDFSNLYAQPLPFNIHPEFKDLQDTILVVSSEEKALSSSAGHELMKGHPYASGRYNQAQHNLNSLITALRTGDADLFVSVVENEALSLHALIMSSVTNIMLLKPASISIIEKITRLRKETKIPVCYTIDAGPNIHMLYPAQYKDKIDPFIASELIPLCSENQVIFDHIGKGPEQISV
jgi:diphosphomevalonate decarboxylase